MLGAILVIVAMVIVLPVGLFVAGGIWSVILGWTSVRDAEARYEGTETLEQKLW